MCSACEVPESAANEELSAPKFMSSHSRIRSNPNLSMLMSHKEAHLSPSEVNLRRKHSFAGKSRALPSESSLRNTWSSLAEPSPTIKIVSMDSPNSPKRTSMNSLDICLATPLQYSRHRSQQKTPSAASRRVSSPIYRKSKHRFFPAPSQSSAEENRENSATPTDSTTPPNPYQSVISFSFNVSDTDLDLSGDQKVIRMDVTPTRRLKSTHSISPKTEDGMLIDVSDSAHLGSTINVKDDFESLDLSNLTPCAPTLPTPAIENNREAQDTLIELIDKSAAPHEWEGEELVGSNDDEENMIFYNSDQCKSERDSPETDSKSVETVETPKTAPVENGAADRGAIAGSEGGENAESSELECGGRSSEGSAATTREPSPIPPEKPATPAPHLSYLHMVDPLSFSLSDYFRLSPEDRANAARYRKQLELEEQQRIARRRELERARAALDSSLREKGETGETGETEGKGEEGGEEVRRKFEEEFSKRMKKKEEEEDRKRAELARSAEMVRRGRVG